MVAAHYRSHVEFCFEALDEAAAGFRRIEGFLDARRRACSATSTPAAMLCAEFVAAMDDDLGTPAAVAVIHDVVREGNKLLADGASDALRGNAASVRGDARRARAGPGRPGVGRLGGRRGRQAAGGGRRTGRRAARPSATPPGRRKDFAAADAIRDRIKAAGIEIEDTPDGPRWSRADGRQLPAQGRDQKTGKGNPTAGSGGRVKRGLEGRGPDAEGEGPPEPQGLQGSERSAAEQGRRARPTRRGRQGRRLRVGRRAQLRRRGAAGEHAGDRGCTSPRAPSATAGCARRSRWPPSAGSPCSRCRASSSTG